jgi:hypothetical protein
MQKILWQETIVAMHEIYNKWAKQQFFREPEVFYTLLKRLIRKEALRASCQNTQLRASSRGLNILIPDLTQSSARKQSPLADNKGFNL